MKTWIVRTVVVAAVVGAFAVGRGLRASAEVPAGQGQKAQSLAFLCKSHSDLSSLTHWLAKNCEPDRAFTVTHVPALSGELLVACCVGH
jgi:hypothetical protein